MEELDFHSAARSTPLANAQKGVSLPADALHVASLDTAHVVYVALDIRGIDRVRKAEAAEAAKLISRQLGGDLLLVFTNTSCSQLHFIYPSFDSERPILRRMVVERDLPRRTAIQQIANIYHQWQEKDSIHIALESAFDVEAVTKQFFTEYKRIFDAALEKVKGFGQSPGGQEALCTDPVQPADVRLLSVAQGLAHLQWEEGLPDALWKDYVAQKDETKFYSDRLFHLFFFGLNNPQSQDLNFRDSYMEAVYGSVRFLNGGLLRRPTWTSARASLCPTMLSAHPDRPV